MTTKSSASDAFQSLSPLEKTLKTRLIVDVGELCRRLELPDSLAKTLADAVRAFPLRFPESLLGRVEKGNPRDPVLAQFLPSPAELENVPGFETDPLCEQNANPVDASACLLRKYAGRVLALTTDDCAARCRFCFRRHFPKNRALFPIPLASNVANATDCKSDSTNYFDRVFANVRADLSIREVIFSGGDPLALSNTDLKTLLYYIKSLKHVKRVRFHSRVPILSPARIDADFPCADEFDDYFNDKFCDPFAQNSVAANANVQYCDNNNVKIDSNAQIFAEKIGKTDTIVSVFDEKFEKKSSDVQNPNKTIGILSKNSATVLNSDQFFEKNLQNRANVPNDGEKNVKNRLVLHLTLHVNSPNEIDSEVVRALFELRRRGYILTSQTVLLKGINDSADILESLYEKLIDAGVVPYYLHQLDRVRGAAAFETPVEKGLQIVRELAARLPGYAVPQYVREIPDRPMKTNLFWENFSPNADEPVDFIMRKR